MNQETLPVGWRITLLGEVWASAQAGFAAGARSNDGVRQLRMNNVRTTGEFDWSAVTRVPAPGDVRTKYALAPGDLVFNNTNSVELVGKSALVGELDEATVFSNHFTRLRFVKDVEPRYVAHWLRSLWERRVFESGCDRWIGQAGYQIRKLRELSLPLPPLPEQRRIADRLDAAMTDIAAAHRLIVQEKGDLRRLLDAEFGAALNEGWSVVPLARVAEINPRRPRLDRSDAEPTSFIPMDAVDGASGTATPVERPYGEVRRGYTYFEVDDVLFAKITPCMENGKQAVAANLLDGFGFGTTEFHVVRARQGVLPAWLHRVLRQPLVRHHAAEAFTGAVGQQRVPPEFLLSLGIPVPPVSQQRAIVAELDELSVVSSAAMTALDRQAAALDALGPALLAAAFRGEL